MLLYTIIRQTRQLCLLRKRTVSVDVSVWQTRRNKTTTIDRGTRNDKRYNFTTMATLLLTSIIVCVIACAIAITTSDQTINLSALTGNLCRVSSNADVFPHAKYRHRFHICPEPVVFAISPSPLVLLILIIRGGDVSRNPGPIRRQCSAGC